MRESMRPIPREPAQSVGCSLNNIQGTMVAQRFKATGHRDVVGASNIRDKGMNGEITTDREMPKYQETKYCRVEVCPHVRQWRSAPDRAA